MGFDNQFLSLLIILESQRYQKRGGHCIFTTNHTETNLMRVVSNHSESEFPAKFRRQQTKEISENITTSSNIKWKMHHKKLKELVWLGATTIELCRSCLCFSALKCICYCRLIASVWGRNDPGSLFHFRNHRCCCTHSVYNLRGECKTTPNQENSDHGPE